MSRAFIDAALVKLKHRSCKVALDLRTPKISVCFATFAFYFTVLTAVYHSVCLHARYAPFKAINHYF